MRLIERMRALVNTHRKRTASPLPTPKWLVTPRCTVCFVEDGESVDDAWGVIMEATFEGLQAYRIGDAIYLTGRPCGFRGECQ